MCLPDDIGECLRIQEVTGEVRSSLKLLSINGKNVCMPVFAQCDHISSNFIVGSCKTTQLNDMSASVKKVNKICFSVLFRFSNNTALGKNAIFRWFWFPQVVHKQTLGEVGN